MSGDDRRAGRDERNLVILEGLLAIKAEWGDQAPDADLVAKLALMRSRRRSVPDGAIAELLWGELQLVNGKLREGMEFLEYAVDALAAGSRAAHQKGYAHVLRAKELRLRGLSAAEIGVRMGHDEGRAGAYAVRVVRRWLAVSTTKG